MPVLQLTALLSGFQAAHRPDPGHGNRLAALIPDC
jgi:hypothetical protein